MKEIQYEGLDIQVSRNEQTGMLVVDICTAKLAEKDVHPGDQVPNIRIMVNECPIRFREDGSIYRGYEAPPHFDEDETAQQVHERALREMEQQASDWVDRNYPED